MAKLLHHKLDPSSRLIRLMASEYSVKLELEEISPWKRAPEFMAISPAGTLPVLFMDGMPPIVGPLANIAAVEEMFAPSGVDGLIPTDAAMRYECWRLIDWVLGKLNDEVTRYVLEEKLGRRDRKGETPDVSALRAAKINLGEHMHYFNWLFASRTWFAGEEMSLADFALAAHFSALDYLGDIDWGEIGETRDWYARMKSRPSFRPVLGDRIVSLPPSRTYADLDF